MNKNRYLSFSLAFLALCLVFNLDGCHGVFTPDPKDQRLPAYTESGNSVSGILVKGVGWGV